MIKTKAAQVSEYRRRAEEIEQKTKLSREQVNSLDAAETEKLIHELRVHQIELEMQNEELRNTQVQLEISHARYFELFDLAPVGYFTLNSEGQILEANLTAASLFGTTRDFLVKQIISRFILRDDQEIYQLHHKKLNDTSIPQSCDLRMIKKDGSQLWVRVAITNALDGLGRPAVGAALSDITEQVLLQKSMQESEERYRTLVEWSPEPVLVQRDGIIIYINPAAIRMFSATLASEVVGRKLLDFMMSETGLQVLSTQMYEQQYLRLDGAVIDVEVLSTVIIYDGKPAMYVAMRDVTERKRLDAILQEKNAELEKARLIADKASLAKSDFLSSMSHDLRTPLSAILGFAQLIESGKPEPTPSQKKSIEQILKAGWYLLELINKILDLALIESGKLTLEMEKFSLEELIRECLTMIEGQARGRSVALSFVPSEAACFAHADRTRLKQVLINLLANAIKYNKSGGEVTVGYTLVSETAVSIFVRDTGSGLSPEQLDQLFEPFNRLGQMASVEEGTGIGLVVCKRLVTLMGGKITVASRAWEGSVFTVELALSPALAQPPRALAAEEQSVVVSSGNEASHPKYLVLYVEDNQANLMLVEDLLARRGDIRLVTALDGPSGIEIARSVLPDLILMDINLPGMSGIQALKILLETEATAGIPVIAISANAIPRDIERGLALGFCRYITKPLNVKQFMEMLDEVLIHGGCDK